MNTAFIFTVAGIALILAAIFMFYSILKEEKIQKHKIWVLALIFAGGIVLLVLSDPSNQTIDGSLKEGHISITKKTDVEKQKIIEDYSIKIGALAAQIGILTKAINEQSVFNSNVKKVVDELTDKVSFNTRYSITANPSVKVNTDVSGSQAVPIIYRDGRSDVATALADVLLKAGIKSSTANSSLSEVKQWLDKDVPNLIYIANANLSADMLRKIELLAKGVADRNPGFNVYVSEGWSFKSSNAQIFIL